MYKLPIPCPVCKKICINPEELRVHRIDHHKGIYKVSYANSKAVFSSQQ
jgi:hypothetical protein